MILLAVTASPDLATSFRRLSVVTLKWLGAIPWIAVLFGMPFANRVQPFVLGLPLPLFWAVLCTILSAAVLAIVYAFDPANRPNGGEP